MADQLDALLGALNNLRHGELQSEVRKLRAAWDAFRESTGISEGDRVILTATPKIETPSHGWWRNRECLVAGATATVVELDFFESRKRWVASIRLDAEWTVGDYPHPNTRTWYGPGPAPDGLATVPPRVGEPDRRHLFMLGVHMLRRLDPEEVVETIRPLPSDPPPPPKEPRGCRCCGRPIPNA